MNRACISEIGRPGHVIVDLFGFYMYISSLLEQMKCLFHPRSRATGIVEFGPAPAFGSPLLSPDSLLDLRLELAGE